MRWILVLLLGGLSFGSGSPGAAARSAESTAAIAFRGGDWDIYTIRADGSGLRQVTSGPDEDVSPDWSPDRSRIAFERRVAVGEDFRGDTVYRHDLYVVNADGSELRKLVTAGSGASWSPDGRTIAFLRGFRAWSIRVDGTGGRQLTRSDTNDLAWSPTGKLIALTGVNQRVRVFLMNPDGTGRRSLPRDTSVEGYAPSWSPEGRHVCFHGFFDDDHLYVVATDGRLSKRIPTPYTGIGCDWSPDGRRLLFTTHKSSHDVWTVRPNGSMRRRVLRNAEEPEWSPDGRSLAFLRRSQVYVATATGGDVRRVTSSVQPILELDW
jgi:TolB protein